MSLKNRTTTTNQYNGGRSTSQVSIYDYPEHLNPFYEDENHKRIRFWHIGKNYKYQNNESRRGSFSLSGLRDMWAFKTFRLKKKSSNLGINKTSESPPPLRKDLDSNKNHYETFDPRLRHTLANNMFNNNFLRNAPYRASLQDMRSKQNTNNDGIGKEFGFGRNDQYRSTMQTMRNRSNYMDLSSVGAKAGQSPQTPSKRYVYGGSITPQPRLRVTDVEDYNSGETIRGSSQMSLASKNPFEEDDNDVVLRKISVTSNSLDIDDRHKRYTKKKRRAPAPPIPKIPQNIDEYTQIFITDENNCNIFDESVQITDLAVEIQKYIKSTDENVAKIEENNVIKCSDKDFSELSSNRCEICLPEEQSKKLLLEKNTTLEIKLQNIEEQNTTTTKINNKNDILHSSNNFKKDEKLENVDKTILKIIKAEITDTKKPNTQENHCKSLIIRDEKESSAVSTNQENSKFEIEIKVNNAEVNSNIAKPNIKMINEKPSNCIASDDKNLRAGADSVEQISKNYATRTKITSPLLLRRSDDTEVDTTKYEHEQESAETDVIELKITESAENLSQKSETSNEIITEVGYVPLNNDDDEIKKMNLYTVKKLTYNDVNGDGNNVLREKAEGNNDNNNASGIAAQHQRRRSVREIIESINRNQKLLKVNQSIQLPPKENDANNNNNSNNNINNNDLRKNNNIKAPPRKKHELKMKQQPQDTNNDLAGYEKEIECISEEMQTARFDINSTTTDEFYDKLTNKINNNDEQNCENIFKKCEIKKKINRESSPTSSNLDWNPVPKPKRTKKLSVELQEK